MTSSLILSVFAGAKLLPFYLPLQIILPLFFKLCEVFFNLSSHSSTNFVNVNMFLYWFHMRHSCCTHYTSFDFHTYYNTREIQVLQYEHLNRTTNLPAYEATGVLSYLDNSVPSERLDGFAYVC